MGQKSEIDTEGRFFRGHPNKQGAGFKFNEEYSAFQAKIVSTTEDAKWTAALIGKALRFLVES